MPPDSAFEPFRCSFDVLVKSNSGVKVRAQNATSAFNQLRSGAQGAANNANVNRFLIENVMWRNKETGEWRSWFVKLNIVEPGSNGKEKRELNLDFKTFVEGDKPRHRLELGNLTMDVLVKMTPISSGAAATMQQPDTDSHPEPKNAVRRSASVPNLQPEQGGSQLRFTDDASPRGAPQPEVKERGTAPPGKRRSSSAGLVRAPKPAPPPPASPQELLGPKISALEEELAEARRRLRDTRRKAEVAAMERDALVAQAKALEEETKSENYYKRLTAPTQSRDQREVELQLRLELANTKERATQLQDQQLFLKSTLQIVEKEQAMLRREVAQHRQGSNTDEKSLTELVTRRELLLKTSQQEEGECVIC